MSLPVPDITHIEKYRERCAFYRSEGHDDNEIARRMQAYFPWFGVQFRHEGGVQLAELKDGDNLVFFAIVG